jgi:hypothetical protein
MNHRISDWRSTGSAVMIRGASLLRTLPRGGVSTRVDIGIARALNMQIRRIADMLPGGLEHEYGFSCECGCGGIARRPAAAFDSEGGAWLDGHRGLGELELPLRANRQRP